MTIVEAARLGRWIKRRRWGSWVLVDKSTNSGRTRPLLWEDIIADDWMVYESDEEPEQDDSSKRFSLIELD